jgi:hypothetical protein
MKPGNQSFRCRVTDVNGSLDVPYTGRHRIYEVNETLERNIELSAPPDGSIINTTWGVFECNISEHWVKNLTLFINDTANYTEYGTNHSGYNNISQNISGFSEEGVYEWDCRGCSYEFCDWSVNGNWSFTWELLLPPAPSEAINITLVQKFVAAREKAECKSFLCWLRKLFTKRV